MSEIRKKIAAAGAKLRPWDPAEYLEDPANIVAYLEAAFEDGDPQVITAALGDVARSKGMTAIAAKSGLGRESLYKALSSEGNPAFTTVLNVLEALGLRLFPQIGDQKQSVPEMDEETGPRDLAKFTRECFAPLGGVELELPPRGPMREPPEFS